MEQNKLTTQPAVMQAVIQITRKATGKVEEYVITGTPIEIEDKALEIEARKDQA
jgi:hypothetical protein